MKLIATGPSPPRLGLSGQPRESVLFLSTSLPSTPRHPCRRHRRRRRAETLMAPAMPDRDQARRRGRVEDVPRARRARREGFAAAGAAPRLVRGRGERDRVAGRRERLRQDHAAAHRARPRAARPRHHPDRRPRRAGSGPRPRLRVPAAEPAAVAHCDQQCRARSRAAGHGPGGRAGRPPSACSRWSAFRSRRASFPISCPAACSSASALLARSPSIPRYC